MGLFRNGKAKNGNTYKGSADRRRSPVYTVHARTAERRSENLHKTGAIALLVVALIGLGWASVQGATQLKRWLFMDNDQFVVRKIQVTTSGRLTLAHIKEYAGISEGRNLFDLDLDLIRKRLEDVPVIRDVEVQRHLPATLIIRVNERLPLARVTHGQPGFYFSIDRDGHVLGLAGPQLKNLPIVKGFADKGLSPGSVLRDAGATDALSLISQCDGTPMGDVVRVQTIDVGNPDFLEVLLQNNTKVLLPRNPSRAKLDDLVTILGESGGRHSFIDLTVDKNIPML